LADRKCKALGGAGHSDVDEATQGVSAHVPEKTTCSFTASSAFCSDKPSMSASLNRVLELWLDDPFPDYDTEPVTIHANG
jgi:hypothetical protein